MPNRRHYRGPRRPAPGGGEGLPADSSSPLMRAEGEGAPAGEGLRPPGRRRRRGRGGGRGPRPGVPGQGFEAADTSAEASGGDAREEVVFSSEQGGVTAQRASGTFGESGDFARSEGAGPDGARRRRRRRGRGRRPEERSEITGHPELADGEQPSDYIALPVERGMPVLYEPRQPEVIEDEPELEPRRPVKSKRVNSGKLFWYIRSKSYVPIPELRRRFEITPDEMGTIQDDGQKLYVGLPQDVADVVANLRRQQKIGIECSVDFTMPVVIGVYPLNR